MGPFLGQKFGQKLGPHLEQIFILPENRPSSAGEWLNFVCGCVFACSELCALRIHRDAKKKGIAVS